MLLSLIEIMLPKSALHNLSIKLNNSLGEIMKRHNIINMEKKGQ